MSFADCNINISVTKDPAMAVAEGFKPYSVSFGELVRVLKMQGRYAPFWFKDCYRKSENRIAKSTNAIVLDFDDGMSIDQFRERIRPYSAYVGTTKSHHKDKNGKTCDRFRAIIPLLTAMDIQNDDYSATMAEIYRSFPGVDTGCKDAARAYAGNLDAETEFWYGDLFDWEPYLERANRRKEMAKWAEEQKRKGLSQKERDGDIFKAMKSRFNRLFMPGNRNNAVADIILWGKKEGVDTATLERFIGELVYASSDPLPDRELAQIFKYHFRRTA